MGVEGIYEEKEKYENIYFNLNNYDEEQVVIELVNKNGDHLWNGNILFINKKTGKIHAAYNVNRDCGFERDSNGSVIIS